MRRFFIAFVILYCVAACDGPARPEASEGYVREEFTLTNGMRVVVLPNTKVPAVSHQVWYFVGAAEDPPGKSGLAHFLEHLMFKGTDTYPSGEFSEKVARLGGNENAFTGRDFTAYFQNIARDRLEVVMGMEADRMVNLVLAQDEVRKERDVVAEERRQRTEVNPEALLRERMRYALLPGLDYARPVIGPMADITSLTREDALAFYRRYYRPGNAVLIVSGDMTAEELKPLAERTYGAIPARAPVTRTPVGMPGPITEPRLTLRDPKVSRAAWMREYRAPSLAWGATEHAYPLLLVHHLLGGSDTAYLYRELVTQRQLAVSVRTWYSDFAWGPSVLAIHAIPKAGVSMEELERAIDEALTAWLHEGITPEALERAKKRLLADAVYSREGLFQPGYIAGAAIMSGVEYDYLGRWDDHITAVTVEQAMAAARAVLQPDRQVTGWLLPEVKNEEGETP